MNMETRYYDRAHNRLVYLEQSATPGFWDDQWSLTPAIRQRLLNQKNTFVTQITRRYLKPEDGPILEGGCGTGQHVAALTKQGYRCIGVDNAPNTVAFLNQAIPELDIRLGDVQNLDFFEDAAFAGYWSLGVIEHGWDGYEAIGREIARLVRPGGYLFLTFPYLSPLRALRARLKHYPAWDDSLSREHFYQFALDHRQVVSQFSEWGFTLQGQRALDGIKGLKSEITPLHGMLQALYDYRGRSLPVRGLRSGLSWGFSLFAGHMMLLVFQKNSAP